MINFYHQNKLYHKHKQINRINKSKKINRIQSIKNYNRKNKKKIIK